MTGVASPPDGFRRHGVAGGYVDSNGPIYVCDRFDGDTVTVMPAMTHCNDAGVVSGGFLLLLLDIAMGIAISARVGVGNHCPTIQMGSNFLSPARAGSTIIGSARIDRLTRSVAFLSAALRTDTGVVATATGVYRIPPKLADSLFTSR